MSRLKGEINSEEKQTLEAKIVELKKTLDEKKSTLSLLEAQIKKLHVTNSSFPPSNVVSASFRVLAMFLLRAVMP